MKKSLTKQREVQEDRPTRADRHHGSTTQGGSNYGQGSLDLGKKSAYRQGSEAGSGSNYGNEKGWINEALRKEDYKQGKPAKEQKDHHAR